MKFILKIIISILNFIFYFMKLLPVQNKIVYISRQSNQKSEDMALLEAAIYRLESTSLKQVFLCKKFDGNIIYKFCYGFHMLKQMYHLATAKIVVLDSYCIAVSVLNQRSSLVVIQMWHALGALKKFGLSIVDKKEGRSGKLADVMKMHKNYTYILTSSQLCAPYFSQAFGYDETHIKVMSLPRVDKLKDENIKKSISQKIYEAYPSMCGKKIVVYAPTFRKESDISEKIQIIAQQFDNHEYAFVLKKHPLMKETCDACIDEKNFSTLEMMMVADYIICDYSAVIFEASLLKKPIFFYVFDYEKYCDNRDFYIDYMKEMPGIISSNPYKIAESIKNDDYDLERVEAFGRKYVEHQQDCSQALANMIVELSKQG